VDGSLVDYAYDALDRLASAKGKEVGGVTNRWQEQFTYGYDAGDNLTKRTNNALVGTFAVDNLNRLTSRQLQRDNLSFSGRNAPGQFVFGHAIVSGHLHRPVQSAAQALRTFVQRT
jgi:hypothetical protein